MAKNDHWIDIEQASKYPAVCCKSLLLHLSLRPIVTLQVVAGNLRGLGDE